MGIWVGFLAPAITAGLTAIGVGQAAATFLGSAFAQLLTGVSLAALSSAVVKKPNFRVEDQRAAMTRPTTLPAFRFVYGNTEGAGTPAPADVVENGVLYGSWIVNSRPSKGPFSLYLDGREVLFSGDPYDFSVSGGATATAAPFSGHLKFWIGLGDQTTPPVQITDEVPYVSGTAEDRFKTTDAWQGRTVVWMRAERGDQDSVPERWPSYPNPPEVALRGPFSMVWDPRDPGQDQDDPATWDFSDNWALCVLDALRRNPVAPHDVSNLRLDTFTWAADVSDEPVSLKAGGSELRYRLSGALVFSDQEIEDQLEPMVAGAGRFVNVAGQLGLIPAIWQAPVYTLTDIIGDSFEYRALQPDAESFTHMRTYYTSAARQFETADLGPWPIPGATPGLERVFVLELPFVESGTQAQRVQKIEGLRLLERREIVSVAPSDMINVLPAANIDVALPGRTRSNGTYRAVSLHGAMSPMGDDGGVALRVPYQVRETSSAVYDWDPLTDEADITVPAYDASYQGTAPPGTFALLIGPTVDLNTGGTIIKRARFAFDPSPTSAVVDYEWQYLNWTIENFGQWTAGGVIDALTRDGSDKVFGYLSGFGPTDASQVRARARGPAGASGWVYSGTISTTFTAAINSATAGPGTGEATFNVTISDEYSAAGARVYRSADTLFGNAVAVTGTIQADPGETLDLDVTGLPAGTGYFWVTVVTQTDTEGPATGPEQLTIT
ncbi:MAG: hypothetical protein ACWA5A_09240 [Marinibacterium sp.]